MELIGRIARLQVQESSLKVGERLRRWYDPAPIRPVRELTLDEKGVTGRREAGDTILDVHHATHPLTKNRAGRNGISVGFTSHYGAMRTRFGDHLADGSASENLLVAAERVFRYADVAAGICVETTDGVIVVLKEIIIAEPCVEFSRYALRYSPDAPSDHAVTDALIFLRDGTRGFYATYRGAPVTIALGARVSLL